MPSNYRTYQEFELRRNRMIKAQLVEGANRLEKAWNATTRERRECEYQLNELRIREATQKEAFREAHNQVVKVAQAIGEVQDEMFSSCDEEEDWFHQ